MLLGVSISSWETDTFIIIKCHFSSLIKLNFFILKFSLFDIITPVLAFFQLVFVYAILSCSKNLCPHI